MFALVFRYGDVGTDCAYALLGLLLLVCVVLYDMSSYCDSGGSFLTCFAEMDFLEHHGQVFRPP